MAGLAFTKLMGWPGELEVTELWDAMVNEEFPPPGIETTHLDNENAAPQEVVCIPATKLNSLWLSYQASATSVQNAARPASPQQPQPPSRIQLVARGVKAEPAMIIGVQSNNQKCPTSSTCESVSGRTAGRSPPRPDSKRSWPASFYSTVPSVALPSSAGPPEQVKHDNGTQNISIAPPDLASKRTKSNEIYRCGHALHQNRNCPTPNTCRMFPIKTSLPAPTTTANLWQTVPFRIALPRQPPQLIAMQPAATSQPQEMRPLQPTIISSQNARAVRSAQIVVAAPPGDVIESEGRQRPHSKRARHVPAPTSGSFYSPQTSTLAPSHSQMTKVAKSDVVGAKQERICGYCGRRKLFSFRSMQLQGSRNRARIRCECGGHHKDGQPRMHGAWSLVPNESKTLVPDENKSLVSNENNEDGDSQWIFIDGLTEHRRGIHKANM